MLLNAAQPALEYGTEIALWRRRVVGNWIVHLAQKGRFEGAGEDRNEH